MKKLHLITLLAIMACFVTHPLYARQTSTILQKKASSEDQTWSYSFYRTIANGGEGFVGEQTSLETTINGVAWSIESDASKYLLYASQGQVIGATSSAPSYAIMKTSGIPGNIKSVAIKAKAFSGCTVNVSVKVGESSLSTNNATSATLPTAAADSANFITFTPAEDVEGTIEIRFDQTETKRLPIYIKRIDIVYNNGGTEIVSVNPPTISPLGGYSP